MKEILNAKPDDAFARYALGLEYSGSGETEAALAEFQSLLAAHPDYTNGYFMAAQTLARAERIDEARALLGKGSIARVALAISTPSLKWKPCWTNWDPPDRGRHQVSVQTRSDRR